MRTIDLIFGGIAIAAFLVGVGVIVYKIRNENHKDR